MTMLIVNDSRTQKIFESYEELKRAFKTTFKEINQAEKNGTLLQDNTTGAKYYVDKLVY